LAVVGYFGHRPRTRLLTVRLNGTDVQTVSLPTGYLYCAEWGPTGRIAVTLDSYNNVSAKIFTVNSDGTAPTFVVAMPFQRRPPDSTQSIDVSPCPTSSPDGTQLAFSSNGGLLRSDVWVVDVDGTGLHRPHPTPRRWEHGAVWSPDGAVIAFGRTNGKEYVSPNDIWVEQLDGSSRARVTTTAVRDEYVDAWQPRP
jgi:Tol biopolymer transport system component